MMGLQWCPTPSVVDKTSAACCFYPRSVSGVSSAVCSFAGSTLWVSGSVCALRAFESTRPRFRLYSRVDEILADVRDRADKLAKTSKPLSAILPRHWRSHSVVDVADFTTPLALNSDFSHLAENKSVLTK